MNLEEEISKTISGIILDTIKNDINDMKKLIWKYENELDFVCGVKSGMIMGGIHALFLHRQDKKLIPGDEDTLEVIKIVKSLIPEIKSSSKQSANLQ